MNELRTSLSGPILPQSPDMKEFAFIHEHGQVPESLRDMPFLESFNDTQLDDVLNSSSYIQCEEGDTIIKEGTVEVNIDGRKQVAGAGSIVFFGVNENENMTNVGRTPATYLVLQWFTPRTPKS